MFNGIVEELGEVARISRRHNFTLLEVRAEKIIPDIRIGESISVNGVCLTVVKKENNILGFDLIPQTLKITNLGILKIKERVNLERALKLGDRISGHFVSGHIDSLGIIRKKYYLSDNLCFEVSFPVKFTPYLLAKGSVAVDGISLTVASKKSGSFIFYVIPHTLKNTTLGFKGPSHKVNIEFDILAKKTSNGQ